MFINFDSASLPLGIYPKDINQRFVERFRHKNVRISIIYKGETQKNK